jgi:hypothetical protein
VCYVIRKTTSELEHAILTTLLLLIIQIKVRL